MFDLTKDIVSLAIDLFGVKRAYRSDAKYKDLYLLYVTLDEVIRTSRHATEHYLCIEWDAPFLLNTTRFSSPIEKWVHINNENFIEHTEAVKKFVHSINNCYRVIGIYDPSLAEALERVIRAKQNWLLTYANSFDAGTITDDGKLLVCRALDISEVIEKKLKIKTDLWGVEYPELTRIDQSHEIDTIEKRRALAELGRSNVAKMKELHEQLRLFIKENVKLEQLLALR